MLGRAMNGKRCLLYCFTALALLPVCLGACSPAVRKGPPVYIPGPPAKARLQVLLTFSSEKDLGRDSALSEALLGKRSTKTRALRKPYGVAMHKGKLYITDTVLGTVVIVDPGKARFERLKGDRDMGKIKVPIGVAFDAAGMMYVSDTRRRQVLVYDAEGRHVRSIGNGQTFTPSGIAVRGDKLYLTDVKGHRVLVLDRASGKELSSFGGTGRGPGKTNFPTNLTVDLDGNIYVSEALNGRVQKFSPGGKLLQTYGKLGRRIGELVRPKGVAVDRRSNLYVVDAATEHAQIFDKRGKLLLFFGGNRDAPGALYLPAGVHITYDAENLKAMRPYVADDFDLEFLVIIISQYGPRQVTIFGYGSRS